MRSKIEDVTHDLRRTRLDMRERQVKVLGDSLFTLLAISVLRVDEARVVN